MSVFSMAFLSIGHLQAAVLDCSGHYILPFFKRKLFVSGLLQYIKNHI